VQLQVFELYLLFVLGSVHHLFPMQVFETPNILEFSNRILPMQESWIQMHSRQASLNQILSRQEFDLNFLPQSMQEYDLHLLDMQEFVIPSLQKQVSGRRNPQLQEFDFPILNLVLPFPSNHHDRD
jgi:hypothetical protein